MPSYSQEAEAGKELGESQSDGWGVAQWIRGLAAQS